MTKKNVSDEVTIETSVSKNQSCIQMEKGATGRLKCKVLEAEMSLAHLRIRKEVNLVGVIRMSGRMERGGQRETGVGSCGPMVLGMEYRL